MSATALSRREWISTWFSPRSDSDKSPPELAEEVPQVAVISGRNCLAYQRSFCSSCVERCPVEGAISSQQGLPRVNPDACTGCRICLDVCPAPTKAILMIKRRPLPNTTTA